jgi:hypothetical protein
MDYKEENITTIVRNKEANFIAMQMPENNLIIQDACLAFAKWNLRF